VSPFLSRSLVAKSRHLKKKKKMKVLDCNYRESDLN